MSTWILVVLFGITGWGAGGQRVQEFPSEESCYKALAALRIDSNRVSDRGEDEARTVAYCAPKNPQQEKD